MSDDVTEPASPEPSGQPAPQAGESGDPAARKADAAKPPTAPKGPSPDDHYTRGRKKAEEHFARTLAEKFGVSSLDELAERLAVARASDDDGDSPPGDKPAVPDVRALRREQRKLAEEHAALSSRHERATRDLAAGRERVKRESLRAALAQAGALYPDDEIQILAPSVGLSGEWEPEEIDAKGVATGRSIADVVAARRERRPELYRGDSREGTGSRPARTVPSTSNGKSETNGDPNSPAYIRDLLARGGIT